MIRRLLGRAMRATGRTPPRGRLIVTGGAGYVATLLRPWLRESFATVDLVDRVPPTNLARNERFACIDLRRAHALADVAPGADAIVHLAACPDDAPLAALLEPNVLMADHVLDSARRCGVRRIVLGSSMHVLGMYRRNERIDETSAPRPDSNYAITKLAAEHLGRMYADKFGLEVVCLRIGRVAPERESSEPAVWIAPEDLAALVVAAATHPAMRFEVVPAVAHYAGDDIGQLRAAARLGVSLTHPGGSYRAALRRLSAFFGARTRAARFRGGSFAVDDPRGDDTDLAETG